MRTENHRLVKALKLLPDQELKSILNQSKELTTKAKKDELTNKKMADKIPVAATRTSLNNNNTTSKSNINTARKLIDENITSTIKSNVISGVLTKDENQLKSCGTWDPKQCTVSTSDSSKQLNGIHYATVESHVTNDIEEDSGVCDNSKDHCFVSNTAVNKNGILVQVKSLIDQSLSQGKALETVQQLLSHQTNILRTIVNTQQQQLINADARSSSSGEWTMVTPLT